MHYLLFSRVFDSCFPESQYNGITETTEIVLLFCYRQKISKTGTSKAHMHRQIPTTIYPDVGGSQAENVLKKNKKKSGYS